VSDGRCEQCGTYEWIEIQEQIRMNAQEGSEMETISVGLCICGHKQVLE